MPPAFSSRNARLAQPKGQTALSKMLNLQPPGESLEIAERIKEAGAG
jgi:hypothetical protein